MQHALAALDQEPAYAAGVEVLAQAAHGHRAAAVDHRRPRAERGARLVGDVAGAVDELVGRRRPEERRAGIELARAR